MYMQDPRTKDRKRSTVVWGMHPRSKTQAAGSRHGITDIPALGTSSTQGDRGINDSFRHLHPSGDSSGGTSARMTCVIPEAKKGVGWKKTR